MPLTEIHSRTITISCDADGRAIGIQTQTITTYADTDGQVISRVADLPTVLDPAGFAALLHEDDRAAMASAFA